MREVSGPSPLQRLEFRNRDDSKSQIRNPKMQIEPVQFRISDLGFEICYRPISKFLVGVSVPTTAGTVVDSRDGR